MTTVRHLARAVTIAALLAAGTAALEAQITQSEYAGRRAAFTSRVGADGIYLVLGAAEPPKDYEPFWQAPNFRYLTGFLEPGAALVIVRKDSRDLPMLFVPPKNPAQEVWTGERLGIAGVGTIGMEGRDAGTLRAVLDSVLAGGSTLHAVGDFSRAGGADVPGTRAPRTVDDQYLDRLKERYREMKVVDATRDVMMLRGKKSAAELGLIRMAAKVSAAAHKEVLGAIAPDVNEFEVQALAEYTFRRNGGDRPSYGSIVGSGPNSTTLHYNRDDRFMNAGEVVNMDMATYYGGYSADITRTVPVGGKFSPEQRDVYSIVLDAQLAAEQQIKVGAPFRALNDAATRVLRAGLAKVGLIEGPDATYDVNGRQVSQLSLYYMHGLGHPIGLEVHDVDVYNAGALAEGSVFTIEPGIYVRANTVDLIPDTPANAAFRAKVAPMVRKYASIGVRIEDDYVVTASGFDRISADAPREMDAIEREMAKRRGVSARDGATVDAYRKIRP